MRDSTFSLLPLNETCTVPTVLSLKTEPRVLITVNIIITQRTMTYPVRQLKKNKKYSFNRFHEKLIVYNSSCLWVTIRWGAPWVNNSLLSSWNHMILLSVKFLKMSSLSSKLKTIWIVLTGYIINKPQCSQGISVRNQCSGCVTNSHWCNRLRYINSALKEAQTKNQNLHGFSIKTDVWWRGGSFNGRARCCWWEAKPTVAVGNSPSIYPRDGE